MVFILLFKSFLPRPGGDFYVNVHIYHLPEEPPPPEKPPPKPPKPPPPPPPNPPPPNHQGPRPPVFPCGYARETKKSKRSPRPIKSAATGMAVKIEAMKKCQIRSATPPPKTPPCHQALDRPRMEARIWKIIIARKTKNCPGICDKKPGLREGF